MRNGPSTLTDHPFKLMPAAVLKLNVEMRNFITENFNVNKNIEDRLTVLGVSVLDL